LLKETTPIIKNGKPRSEQVFLLIDIAYKYINGNP
jgi:hypothetical protein